MTVLLPPLRIGVLAGVNPVAKLGALVIIAGCLIASIDPVSATVALIVQVGILAALRIPARDALVRVIPVLIVAPLAGLTTVLYGQSSGVTYLHWFFVEISAGSLTLGIATSLRVLAIGIPAVVVLASIDPSDLADGLAQVLHLPARFVMGGLAGLRLIGLLADDWRMLGSARRARGVADRARLARLAGQIFALLVLSLRRASTLATAMESRAFGASHQRSWARESRLHRVDALVLVVAVAVSTLAIGVAIVTGAWNPVFGA